ncbi:MAG: hypothetical protein H8F28_24940 [Fibrella sp.]|nr:hypothetical protein [Armatimonadota bacterium]
MADILAKLRFQKQDNPTTGADEWGELILDKNGIVRLSASDSLRDRLLRTAQRVDHAALMYGASAFMGIAAIGTTLIVKRKTVWGYLFLALAALVAIGGSDVRRIAKNAPRILDTLTNKNNVSAAISREGALTIMLANKPWKGTTLRFEAGEFNLSEAIDFIAALKTKP